MSNRTATRLTPLWIISLFLSLTEVVTGLAVTQATGGVQFALTAFVITFPVVIALAFFLILAFRPYVLYPPGEFSRGINVSAYVQAMQNKLPAPQANAQLESASLRAEATLNTELVGARLESLEAGIRSLLATQDATHNLLQTFDAQHTARLADVIRQKEIFEANSRYRLEVAAIVDFESDSVARERDLAESFALSLARQGYNTTTRVWNKSYYAKMWESEPAQDATFIVYRPTNTGYLDALVQAAQNYVPGARLHKVVLAEAVERIQVPEPSLVNADRHVSVVFYRGTA